MSGENNNSQGDRPLFDVDTQQFYLIQFWLYLLLIIPSMSCSLFALYHFIRDRALRQALHNHFIIVLLLLDLFYQMTDMVWCIHYFQLYQSITPTRSFRLVFGYIDWTFYDLQFALYAWVTIERHILIFHHQLSLNRKKRVLVCYLPPVAISVYCLLYYIVIFFIPLCDNDFTSITQPGFLPCPLNNEALNMYQTLVHGMLPIFVIVISTVLLLLRTLWQRYHNRRQIHWRQYRKMTLQVLLISCIYLILPFPLWLVTLLHMCGMPADIGAEFLSRSVYFGYYALFLFPMLTVGSLPELRNKLKNTLKVRRQRRITAS